jgi:hypothetical protein
MVCLTEANRHATGSQVFLSRKQLDRQLHVIGNAADAFELLIPSMPLTSNLSEPASRR